MALTDLTVKDRTIGDGIQAAFPIPFTVIVDDSAETQVWIRDESVTPHTQALKVEGSANDYVLTGAIPPGFHTHVTFNAGKIPSGTDRVVIVRKLPLTQILDLITSGNFQAQTQEQAFDRTVAMIQELDEKFSRCLQIEQTTPLANIDTPIDPVNADKVLVINATGDGLDVGLTTAALLASEAAAAASAAAAAVSETNAATSETNAGTSETNAAASELAAAASELAAATSETNAGTSETNAGTSETNAATSETNAATSETNAATSEANAAISALQNFGQGVEFKTFADSPLAIVDADVGKLFSLDCSGGSIVVNLPAISTLTLDPFTVAFKKSEGSANTVTINRAGSDTIDGGASVQIAASGDGYICLPEDSTTPDKWATMSMSVGAAGILLAANNLSDVANAATSRANLVLGNVDNTSDATKNAAVATLTNKTLTAPAINSPTGIVKGDVGLGNVDNTSDAAKNAAVATLTNKTLTSPAINSPTGIVKGDVGLGNVDNTSNATERAATATLTGKTFDDAVTYKELATPSNPAATYHKVYPKSDGKIYALDSAGNEVRAGHTDDEIAAKSVDPFGTRWLIRYDDFSKPISNDAQGELGLGVAKTGTGALFSGTLALISGEENRVGMCRITAPSATGYISVYNALSGTRFGNGVHRYGASLQFSTGAPDVTNDYISYLGYNLSSALLGTYASVFVVDRTLSTTNFYARTRKASTDTDTDTGVALDGAFHVFEIIVNSDNTSHKFYIDGTLVATHTTNLPNASMGVMVQQSWVAGASSKIDMDLMLQGFKPGTARGSYHTWLSDT